MTTTGWARTMANSTAVRVSGPAERPPTPGSRPLPFLSFTAQAHPTLVPLGVVVFPVGSAGSISGSSRMSFHLRGLLSNFPGCL